MKNYISRHAIAVVLLSGFATALNAQEINVINNIEAGTKTAYFDFATGQETSADSEDWDIAFERTTILVNGGSSGKGKTTALLLKDAAFESVDNYPSSGFKTDTQQEKAIPAGSGNGWYAYDMATHSINPIPKRVILIKTSDDNYVKLEIRSYYHESSHEPANYSFRYSFL